MYITARHYNKYSEILQFACVSGLPLYAACCRAGDEASSCPDASVLWLCRQWIFELPRISHASAISVGWPRVSPLLCLL